MTFFQQLSALKINGDLQIIIRQDPNTNLLAVLVHMTNHKAQEGGLTIPDIKINGPATAIDEGFFERLTQPIADAINTNIDDFLTQLEANKAAGLKKSAPAGSSTSKPAVVAKPEPTPQEIRKQKFSKIMGEIDALIEQKKFKEATAKLPKSTEWTEFISEIANKKSDINRAASADYSLFAGSPTAAPPALAEESSPESLPATEEDSTIDNQSTDNESTDEESIDDESTDEE